MLQRLFRYLSLILLFSVLMASFGSADALHAPAAVAGFQPVGEGLPTCANLDVIFVVDQSDSMSIPPASDPLQNRKNAIAAMIDLLVDLAVDQCPENSYRVAVVSFGNQRQARVDLQLSNISPNTAEEGRALRDKLVQSLKADTLGQTFPAEGFYEAYRIFRDASRYGEEPRKKVILFMTDGIPCTDTNPACLGTGDPKGAAQEVANAVNTWFSFRTELLQAETCLADLRAQHPDGNFPADAVNNCLQSVPDNKKAEYYDQSTYIYTMLLKPDISYPAGMLDVFEKMSKDHAGQMVELKRNLSEIPSTMRQILSELVGIRPNLLACGDPFAVNPYLKKLRVSVYNISEDNKIVLSYVDAQGNSHQIQRGLGDSGFTLADPYYTFGVNERYVFEYPYPGQWQVTAENCEGVDIYAEAIALDELQNYQPNLPDELPEYDIEPFYSVDEPYYLEYQMKVADRVIEQAPQAIFAISAQVQVTAPDGQQYTIPMSYDTAGKKLVAAQPLQLPVDGTYKMVITGKSKWHEGDIIVGANQSDAQVFTATKELFRFENEFKVFPVAPFVLQGVSPTEGEKVYHVHETLLDGWRLKTAPMPVRVRLATREGQALSTWQEVFGDDSAAVTAALSSETGETSQVVTLAPDPDAPGEYIGEIPEFEVSGPQTLTYRINMEAVTETYRPDRQVLELAIERADGLLHTENFYIALFWFIIACIVALIIYNILIRTNKVTGSLIFVDGSETLAEFGLYNGINFRTIKGKELSSYPQFSLKRMKIYNIGKKRRGGKVDEVTEIGDPQGVRVECTGVDSSRFNVDLYPKTPTIYSDQGVGMMIYEPVEE
jgi:hypothetical protein